MKHVNMYYRVFRSFILALVIAFIIPVSLLHFLTVDEMGSQEVAQLYPFYTSSLFYSVYLTLLFRIIDKPYSLLRHFVAIGLFKRYSLLGYRLLQFLFLSGIVTVYRKRIFLFFMERIEKKSHTIFFDFESNAIQIELLTLIITFLLYILFTQVVLKKSYSIIFLLSHMLIHIPTGYYPLYSSPNSQIFRESASMIMTSYFQRQIYIYSAILIIAFIYFIYFLRKDVTR